MNRLWSLFAARIPLVALLVTTAAFGSQSPAPTPGESGGPWGKPVDGLVCRLTVQPRYHIGQPLTAVWEVKNISDKERYIVGNLDPRFFEFNAFDLTGPNGKLRQTASAQLRTYSKATFRKIKPGEIQGVEIFDLGDLFASLKPWQTLPKWQSNAVIAGRHVLKVRFNSPKIPDKLRVGLGVVNGKQQTIYEDSPADMVAKAWTGELEAPIVAFDLISPTKDDFVVHEWGVFTILNDAKFANANRAEEWTKAPSFFYRQFPEQRLRWFPSGWDKPIIYFYLKPKPMNVQVRVTFAEGWPVLWWPAVIDPADNAFRQKNPGRFQTLTWNAWVGDEMQLPNTTRTVAGISKAVFDIVDDFPLPDDSWLRDVRLPAASRLTVTGTNPDVTRKTPAIADRFETERFLYYDGLVPAPDYFHCEKTDEHSLSLRNYVDFDIAPLFVVDRRAKNRVAFAQVDKSKGPFEAGKSRKIDLVNVIAEDWPELGVRALRKALLDAGLFEPEADSMLKIWRKQLFESDGLLAFHLLPQSEYDRMLPLEILPAPPVRPVRVGLALHPNLQIEPEIMQRAEPLLRHLDDAKYDKRAAASKGLLDIGPIAIGMMRAELNKNPSLEKRRRIEDVINRVDATPWIKVPAK